MRGRAALYRDLLLIGVALLGVRPTSAVGQEKPLPEAQQPREVVLETKDGVLLHIKYYPSKLKKNAVPVVLVHGWGGQGADYEPLAAELHKAKDAVIVVDLRGHGKSLYQRIPGTEEKRELVRDRFGKADLVDMAHFDLEAVKAFLVKEHDAGNLNVELLCLVAAEEGAIVALYWIAADWSWPQLPNLKQGQDVQAFVLLSPIPTFKGLPVQNPNALMHPAVRRRLSAMIVAGGEDDKRSADARRVHGFLKRYHPPIPEDPEEQVKKQDLFLREQPTTLQGTKMLAAQELTIKGEIQEFITVRLVNRQEFFPWRPRKDSSAE